MTDRRMARINGQDARWPTARMAVLRGLAELAPPALARKALLVINLRAVAGWGRGRVGAVGIGRTAVNSSANSRLPSRSANARPRSAVAMASSNRPASAEAAANVRCKIGLTPPASFSARSANSTARIPLRSEALGAVASTHARLLCVFPSFASNASAVSHCSMAARV